MASNTRETWKKRLRRKTRAGRKRKNQESRRSTLTDTELFAALGKPGEPVRK
jgi:transposase-like protein